MHAMPKTLAIKDELSSRFNFAQELLGGIELRF